MSLLMIKRKHFQWYHLQWYLTLIDLFKTRLFVNKQDSPKNYKNMNKPNIFFTNRGV